MSAMQDAFSRGAFGGWLEETIPGICEEGNLIVWRGFACSKEPPFLYEYYRVAIRRNRDWTTDIEVHCGNASMMDWMQRHKSYIKGKLIWYCRAVWQLMDDGLLDAEDFRKTEAQLFEKDENEGLEQWELDEKAEAYAEAQRYQSYCEAKYGWDCS